MKIHLLLLLFSLFACKPTNEWETLSTLGQLITQANIQPAAALCISGVVNGVAVESTKDGDRCYFGLSSPYQFCNETFIQTGQGVDLSDQPVWISKGFCDNRGAKASSGDEITDGMQIYAIVANGYLHPTLKTGEVLKAYPSFSPIFNVKDGKIVIGGSWGLLKMAEDTVISSDNFLIIARNVGAAKMLRYYDACTEPYCSTACVSKSSAASGVSGAVCSGDEDCFYAAECVKVVAQEPDVCESCGERYPDAT